MTMKFDAKKNFFRKELKYVLRYILILILINITLFQGIERPLLGSQKGEVSLFGEFVFIKYLPYNF